MQGKFLIIFCLNLFVFNFAHASYQDFPQPDGSVVRQFAMSKEECAANFSSEKNGTSSGGDCKLPSDIEPNARVLVVSDSFWFKRSPEHPFSPNGPWYCSINFDSRFIITYSFVMPDYYGVWYYNDLSPEKAGFEKAWPCIEHAIIEGKNSYVARFYNDGTPSGKWEGEAQCVDAELRGGKCGVTAQGERIKNDFFLNVCTSLNNSTDCTNLKFEILGTDLFYSIDGVAKKVGEINGRLLSAEFSDIENNSHTIKTMILDQPFQVSYNRNLDGYGTLTIEYRKKMKDQSKSYYLKGEIASKERPL